ncbi:sulfatase family protein [Coraliomargarita akajimensis]|uniref:Sulfatase n=1 Tax=Coraliomargarita akajimensis (strain DSM 45221 / IAM 15411 / JCM 23193 / KCTC 12865 / 04OKA010-24) TaxID=583355 RepID=D5EN95_CORAD|nr:sulfatase-like hydrolase/transferase [Coraliomargarita akajimensis]ADE53530.1 sulfatase [Coraliomargarita akajimensis DSM 45221]
MKKAFPLLALVTSLLASAAERQPNIILIFADDLGWGDVGCYGDTNLVPTPHIDRIAAEGVRFTQGYVTAPVCGPSRYGLLMGQYQQRIGVQWNPDTWSPLRSGPFVNETPESSRIGKQRTIDQALKAAGYVTGIAGKYNLPCVPKTTFDESYSVMGFGGNYFPDETGGYHDVDGHKNGYGNKRILWGPEREGDEYLTDRLGRQASEFIENHKDEPFFFYLAFNAPHSPLEAKAAYKSRVAHLESEALKMYGAMVISMDEAIGGVLDTIDRLGLAEDTIVAFASDNGPSYAYSVEWPEDWPKELLGSAGHLRGFKGQQWEGGIRVPYILRWPGHLKAGQVYEEPVSTLDLYPTFCAAAEAAIPEDTHLDGVDLLPFVQGVKEGQPHEALYWQWNDSGAIRKGKWKLATWKDMHWLYDLDADESESKDLAKQYPEVVAELSNDLNAFIAELPPVLNPIKR